MSSLIRPALWATLAAVAVAGPAWAETRAEDVLQTALGGEAAVHLDAAGLRAHNVSMRRGATTLAAREVTIHPTAHGIAVHVANPTVVRAETTDKAPVRRQAKPSAAPQRAAPRRRGPAVPNTHGIPVTVTVSGALEIPAPAATVTITDPVLVMDGRGGASVTGRAHAATDLGPTVATDGSFLVEATDEGWKARAQIAVGGAPSVLAVAELGARTTLRVEAQGGGELAAVRSGDAVKVRLRQMPASTLGDLGGALRQTLGVNTATIDGNATVTRTAGTVHATADNITVTGMRVDHRSLAPDPVVFDALTIDGSVSVSVNSITADAVIAHRQAQAHVSGSWDAATAAVEVRLPAIQCQDLLDSMPAGTADVIATTELEGQIAGRLMVSVDRERLRSARAAKAFNRDDPPGALSIDFPFLSECAVTRDASTVDFAGLSGPYRHRFVSAHGGARTRVMAHGAPGFASLAQGRMVADALITMEDYRFWDHDGFDREQIEHAFWHNLVVGRVSRGASTITQQATRNLWLGINRSAARKMQEALLTARLETHVDKARILELYINIIELGPDVHGVQSAAQFHFGKDVDALTPLQAVHIAALAPAPRRFSKSFASGTVTEVWRAHLDENLRRMRRARLITRAQLHAALNGELELVARD